MKRIGKFWYLNGYGRPFISVKEALIYKYGDLSLKVKDLKKV